jgi:lipopolysaccharide exporter
MEDLKSQVVSGVKWNGVSVGFITGLSFITTVVLARILSPSDFGLMGMIMVVIGFAQAFSDMGLSNAIIQRKHVPENHLSSFFWINIVIGILLFVCILLIRPLAVVYFKQVSISKYLLFTAALFLILPSGQVFTTLLTKELRFRTLAKVDIAGTIVYSISTIGFALGKFGVVSLIFGQLIRSLFTVCLLFFLFRKIWLPKFHFNYREIQGYLSFGAFQMGERVVNYLYANIDYIIIGRFLGPAALGFYSLAYNIMTLPLNKINPIITRVAFPAFSRVQDDNALLRKGYCKVIKYITFLSFPMVVGTLILAPEFIRLVYGAQWDPAIPVLQALCLVGVFKSLGNPIGSILLAKGRADIGFYWNLFALIMVAIAEIVGVKWGIVGVAVAILILQPPFFLIIQPVVNRLINLKFREYFSAIKPGTLCTAIMLAVIAPLKVFLCEINVLALFFIIIVAGIATYSLSFYITDKGLLLEFKSAIIKKGPR